MPLFLKIAHRDLLSQRKLAFYIVLNLTLGFFGLFLLESVKTIVEKETQGKSKEILGADIAISARRKFSASELKILSNNLGEDSKKTKVVELYSMVASTDGGSRLTEIKAIDENYPLYGGLQLTGGFLLPNKREVQLLEGEAWISEDLQFALGKGVGDVVKVGERKLKITQIIIDDSSTSWRGVSLAPRLYMRGLDLDSAKLIRTGSTFSENFLYKLDSTSTEVQRTQLRKTLLEKLEDPIIKVLLPEQTSEQVSRVFRYLSHFLGLVSLVSLLLVSLSLIFLFKSLLQKRIKEMAILKSLGVSNRIIQLIYSYQILILSLISGIAAIILVLIFTPFLVDVLGPLVKVEQKFVFDFFSLVRMTLVGSLFSFFICLPWIQRISKLKTGILFQESDVDLSFSGSRWYSFMPSFLGFIGLSIWQSQSYQLGLLFSALFLFSLLIIILFSLLIFSLIGKYVKNGKLPFERSLALKFLVRKKVTSVLSVSTLALASLLIVLILQIKQGLYSQLNESSDPDRPNLFMFDIQEEQIDGLELTAKEQGLELENLSPMVRGRILNINGKPFERDDIESEFETREQESQRRMRNRGVNLTYRSKLDSSETIVDGESFSLIYDEQQKENFISVEKRYAKRLGLRLGDRIEFDIQSVPVTAVVKNFRKVRWTSFRPNFFIQFQDGVLNDAPKTFIATMRSADKKLLRKGQYKIVQEFANISILNVTLLLNKIKQIFDKITMAIIVMTYLCLIVGFIVFFSIIQSQSKLKAREVGLLKIVGASNNFVNKVNAIEILGVSVISVVIGAVLGTLCSQVMLIYLFDTSYVLNSIETPVFLFAYMLISTFIVYFSLRKLTKTKTIHLLNQEGEL